MAYFCENSPVPVALDEELTGITDYNNKEKLINTIKPQYIVLKLSMIGGFKASEEWISIANKSKTGWWITSALESNVGLNAIAQWTSQFNNKMPQGLGTGLLYENNILSPLYIQKDALFYQTNGIWDMNGVLR
jgi:L-alanine-DL-glutamate epimerase-like enolase superfamily enzyme